MMGLTWLGIAIDVGLCASMVIFGLRMLKSSGPRVNLGRMAELEASLRGLLAEAETGSRALTDHLMRRQKDLEKLLFELEGAQGKANRQITTCEEIRGKLEIAVERAQAALRASQGVNPQNTAVQADSSVVNDRLRQEAARDIPADTLAMASTVEVEPPSFQSVQVAVKARSLPPTDRPTQPRAAAPFRPPSVPHSLQSKIEREVFETPGEMIDAIARPPSPVRRSQRPSAVERAMAFQRAETGELQERKPRDERISARAIEQMERAGLMERMPTSRPPMAQDEARTMAEVQPQEFMETDEMRSSVLSPEEAATASGEDPRLGVLGGAPIRRQVQVL